MFKRLSITTAMILLGSLITNAGKVEAVVYEFSGFDPGNTGTFSASGFFDIDDNGDNVVDWSSELTDFNIEFNNGFVFRQNSLKSSDLAGVSIQGNALDFSTVTSGSLEFQSNTVPRFFEIFANTSTSRIHDAFTGETSQGAFTSFSPTSSSASVPFEFSPSLGLLVVGGIVGVSRLRSLSSKRTESYAKNCTN